MIGRVLLGTVVVAALLAAVGYRLTTTPGNDPGRSTLQPLVAAAALDPCFGPLVRTTDGGSLPDITLPDTTLPCLDGSGRHALVGAPAAVPTLLNVYASWCQPCAAEMPLLRQFYDQARGRVRMIGVDTADDPQQALLFARDLNQRWPSLRDDDGLVNRVLGGGPPKTVLISADGRVVHVQRGAYSSLDALLADVRTYLGLTL